MKNLTVSLGEKSYDIIIERGIFNRIGEEIKKVYDGNKLVVVTDENLNRIYGKLLKEQLLNKGFSSEFIVVEPGEKSKSVEVLQEVYSKLLEFKVTRGDLIVAFGGGVVGDLTGFAAATFLRGVKYIQIPTSLLAQIDSSIGGKVAVNLKEGKNLIGNFYHPKKVIIDPEVLKTLPEEFLKDGMGEVIKYACIKDEELFSVLESLNKDEELMDKMDYIIYTCCNIKREIVEEDEMDLGIRMILNFGHTLAHGIEKYFNYERYTHGEAVSLGIYHITKKSEELALTEKGTAEKIKKLLENYGIQYRLPDMDMCKIKEIITLDKKNISGNINLILLSNIGAAYIRKFTMEEIDNIL